MIAGWSLSLQISEARQIRQMKVAVEKKRPRLEELSGETNIGLRSL
jgi:hypothetical protein